MKMNVILLVGEDTGKHQGCYGDIAGNTPNLDRLASEGCLYENAFSTAPVCAPSRSTLITGQYAFSIGSHHMRSCLIKPPKLFTEYLQDAGSYVNWANKTDFNFQEPSSLANETSNWIDDLALNKIPNNKPWFLYMNFPITHESIMWKDKYEADVAPFMDDSNRTKAEAVRVPKYLPDTPEVREDIARYYDALYLQDKKIGEVLDALERSGMKDETVVIYMSDHGRGLIREKRWCYSAGINLPLIIRYPGKFEPGSRSQQMVSWVDIAPTILEIIGVEIPDEFHGCSIFQQDETKYRQYCIGGRDRMDEAFDRVRTIADGEYLYIRNDYPELPYCQRIDYMEIHGTTTLCREWNADGKLNDAQKLWFQHEKPKEELYHRTSDPDNVLNLALNPEYDAVRNRLSGKLTELLAKYGDFGEQKERDLIATGLVKDQLEEYKKRIFPLPERMQNGYPVTVSEI